MALDAANSIQAKDSLEKMLAHQMAAAHKLTMELMGQVCYEENAAAQRSRVRLLASASHPLYDLKRLCS